MTPPVEIRRATPADAPVLGEIAREVIEDPWPEGSIAQEIRRDIAEVLVASAEAAIVGFLICWRVAEEASLLILAVRRAQQREGIGRALLLEAETSAKRAGMRSMHLEVRETNRGARAFYRALGYADTVVRRGYYSSDGADAVLMEKHLADQAKRIDATLVILAGGRGARMGGLVKALLRDREGRTVLGAIEQILGPHVAGTRVVVTHALIPHLRPHTSSPLIEDLGHGPGAALIGVAHTIDTTWILLVGGDQPRPSAALLFRFLDESSDDIDALVVRLESKRQPLWAFYRTQAITSAFPLQARRSPLPLQAVLDRLRTRVIDGSVLTPREEAAFIDVDTVERADLLGLRSEGVPSIGGG